MVNHFLPPAPEARRRRTTVTALVGGIGLAGFVLVGCGGSSAKMVATTASSAAAPSAAAPSGEASSGERSSAAGSSTGTPASTAAPSVANATAVPHGNSSSSFCTFAREVSSQQDKNISVFTSGNPAAIERLEKQELSVLSVAVSAAPVSIRPAMVLIANADQTLYKELKKVNFDFSKLGPSFAKSFDSTAVSKAGDMVTSYITNVCHISTASPTAH